MSVRYRYKKFMLSNGPVVLFVVFAVAFTIAMMMLGAHNEDEFQDRAREKCAQHEGVKWASHEEGWILCNNGMTR